MLNPNLFVKTTHLLPPLHQKQDHTGCSGSMSDLKTNFSVQAALDSVTDWANKVSTDMFGPVLVTLDLA